MYAIPYLKLRKHVKFLGIFLGTERVLLLLVLYPTGHWVLVCKWPIGLQHVVLCYNLIRCLPRIPVQDEP